MLFICVAKCPELDKDNSKHCCKEVSTELELKELRNKECPCGNVSNFIQAIK